MFRHVSERITDGVAVGAVSSPLWLDYLSTFSSALLPILGCLWLLIQMVSYWRQRNRIEGYVRKEGNAEGRAELKKEQDDGV